MNPHEIQKTTIQKAKLTLKQGYELETFILSWKDDNQLEYQRISLKTF